MAENVKTYSVDEIKKLAPGYRGKPENFNPDRKGKRNDPKPSPKPKAQNKHQAPRAPDVPAPTHKSESASPQRNDSIISEAIFGIDVTVTEIAPRQCFSTSFRKITDIAAEVYDGYRNDEKQLERVVVREEIAYYATALLHLKLIEVKSKQGLEALTSAEKDLRKADHEFNVPQPLSTYISEIGTYKDRMGKETLLALPPLPTTVVQNFGGYHAAAVTTDTDTDNYNYYHNFHHGSCNKPL